MQNTSFAQYRSIFHSAPFNHRVKAANLFLICALLLIMTCVTRPAIAQQCDNIVSGVSDSFASSITIASTGQPIVNGSTIKVGTSLRFDVVATAYGHIDARAMIGSPATCSVYATYERTVNHVESWVDITASGNGSGQFSTGTFFGLNSDRTAIAFLHVLDSSSPDTTGSNYFSPGWPGRYEFHLKAIYNQTAFNIQPFTSETQTYVVYVTDGDDPNLGEQSCPANVGKPVNVTNGNMWLKQTDYKLSGLGANVDITRTYNSKMQRAGVFGYGWTSVFDESITQFGNMLLKLMLPDGQIVYFGRDTAGGVLTPRQPLDFHGQIVQGADGSYTLTFKDGRVHRFNSSGKLLSLADRNNNQTTITYDTAGANPVSISDPGGRTLNLTYDSYGYVGTISDSLGTIATYTHLSWGRLQAVDYPDGSGYRFTDFFPYGNTILLTTVRDALGNILEQHDYDAQWRATTSEVQGGVEKYTLTYTSAMETDVTDALGHVTKYFFDASKGRNVVTRIEGVCGCGGGSGASQVTTWAYDDNLNLITKTDALGHATTYTYDAAGNPLTAADATGTVTYTYNGFSEVLTRTDQMNGVTTMTYDANGNLLTVKDALNKTTTFTPDSHGLITEIKDPLNHATAFEYDAAGNLKKRTDAANNHTDFVYDARGRLTSVTDPLNHTTSYEYDLAGRVKKITRPDNLAISYTYDLGGRRTKITDARGKDTTFGYDGANRLTSVSDPLSHTVTYGYDLMSNRTSVTDALNHTTNFQFDDFNRLVKAIYPPATIGATRLEETTEYDAAGNVTKRTDTAGRATSYEYDSANRLKKVTDAAQGVTQYEYNGRSNLTAVVDAINQRYAFDYDPLGRVTGQTRAGTSMSYLYDDAGRRTQRTDYDNAVTNYTYDSLNRLTEIDYPDSTSATYGYDAMSRLTSAANQSGTVSFSYDALGRVSSTTDVWGKVLDYRYDANGNRIETKLDGTVKASYEYDDANRLTKITDGAGAIVGYGYDLANRLTSKQLPNGVGTVYQYDDMNRLTRITDATATAPVADSQYQYNTANQISQLIDQAGTHVNTYDGVNRLTTASHSGGSIYPESYGYDGGGNRTRSSYSNVYNYSPNNRLTSVPAYSGDAYENSFDNNGNTLTMWRGGDQGGVEFDFTWDAENRVKLVSLAGMSVTEEFSYDALGRRVKTAINSTDWTKYTYDGQDVILDQKSAGSNVEYLNGPGIDNKIRQTDSSTNQPLYFTQDHLGSTRALTDASGNVLGRANYDSFGYAYGGPGLSQFTRYLYTGREYDQNTALYYYRARWYEPQLGRFLSEDPIGLWGGINLYIYANGNPSFYVDPSGNDPVSAGALALGGFEIAGGAALTGAAAVAAYPFALYGAWNLGVWIAEQPWNPLTHPSAEPVADLCPSRPAPVPTPVIPPSPPPIDPSIRSWRKVRNEVLEGNPLCVWCGLPAERNGRPGHGDHIIPRSKGGSDELENAQPACQHCNTSRGNRDFPKTPPDDYTGPWPRPEWSQP